MPNIFRVLTTKMLLVTTHIYIIIHFCSSFINERYNRNSSNSNIYIELEIISTGYATHYINSINSIDENSLINCRIEKS